MEMYESKLWKRQWIVDDEGICELRRGQRHAFISWEALQGSMVDRYRADDGTVIIVRLDLPGKCRLYVAVTSIWKQRFPERWAAGEIRANRRMLVAAFVWMPLWVYGPCLACYVFLLSTGRTDEKVVEAMHTMERCLILGTVLLIIIWIGVVVVVRRQSRELKKLGERACG